MRTSRVHRIIAYAIASILVSPLMLCPIWAQSTVFPYSYSFNTGAQSQLTGDGNWSVSASFQTPLWQQSSTDGTGNGAATLAGFKGISTYSSLTLHLNTSGIFFSPPSRWTFKIRRDHFGTPPGDANALITFSWATEGGPSQSLSGAISFSELPNDCFREVTISLPPEFWHQGPVTLTLTVTTHHNAYIHGGLILDDCSVVNGSSGDGQLPVQLTSFIAERGREGVNLRWSTATETNNYGFRIERRAVRSSQVPAQASQWTDVGFVRGSGTSSSVREYTFVDRDVAFGRYAYRLKQVDLDGAYSYSLATEVEAGITPREPLLVQNFPNPFNPSTVIRFAVPESGPVTLKVFNSIGQEIQTLFDGEAEVGVVYERMFDASRLPSGLYLSRLECNGSSAVRKMVLMK